MQHNTNQNGESLLSIPKTWIIAESEQESIRVAWLRHVGGPHTRSSQIMRLFAEDGISIWVMDSEHTLLESILYFDLIVLEMNGRSVEDLTHALRTIRVDCHAPLLVLFPHKSSEFSLEALEAGADAAMTMAAPAAVVFARAKAMLRRWLPSDNKLTST